ncbi:MAG: hypothetical protein N2689_06530 [Verrucomicrobiae bacterium]|nr:hypothetical protein [Verrucomicrobiae bacterium]
MKRAWMVLSLAGLTALLAGEASGRDEAAQLCPVAKVNISYLPRSEKLLLHPPTYGGQIYLGGRYVGEEVVTQGIEVAVLWANRGELPLRDVILRLEYQQATTGAIRTMEQQLSDVKPGGRWTIFRIRGGEYADTRHIAAWRVSVLSGNQVLGRKQSVMWATR